MHSHREAIRAYVWRHDARLYQAILDFERHSKLPDDIAMPTRAETVNSRLRDAFLLGLDTLSDKERRSVLGKLRRGKAAPSKNPRPKV